MASLDQILDLIQNWKLAQAKTALRKLTRQKSKPGVDWQRAMTVAGHLADHETMLAAAQNWRAESPSDPARLITEITALGAVSKHEEAAALARELQQSTAAAADGYSLEGFYQARFGKREKAIALCREALAKFPDHAAAWEQLSTLDGFDDLDADIAEMKRVEGVVTTNDGLQAISYALARAYDKKSEIDAAFDYIEKAAAARKGPQPFNVAQIDSYLRGLREVFTPDYIKRHEVEGAGEGAVFILSLPRSGSTLLEQILSTSLSVTPTGEHAIMRSATLTLGNIDPETMARADIEYEERDWRKLGQAYLDGLRRRFGASSVYTDKSLTNYIYAGLIRILLPQAKMIWLTRDPRDVAWSCYRHRIQGGPWTESLEATCGFIKAHTETCEYWAELVGDQILHVSYEQLIKEPDDITQKIFDHIGVDRPYAWRDFHKSADPVATNSMAQVREPLNEKGLDAWKRYEKHLKPVFDANL